LGAGSGFFAATSLHSSCFTDGVGALTTGVPRPRAVLMAVLEPLCCSGGRDEEPEDIFVGEDRIVAGSSISDANLGAGPAGRWVCENVLEALNFRTSL